MAARDDLYNYADDSHLGGDYLDELLDRVEAEARADDRKRVADEIHRADRPAFPDGERPDLIVSTLRNVHARIASDGPDAPYWTPEPDHRLAHCSAGLLPIGSAPFEPCVEIGPHDNHRNAAGDTWTDDLTED